MHISLVTGQDKAREKENEHQECEESGQHDDEQQQQQQRQRRQDMIR
jgi:hypothetical protein